MSRARARCLALALPIALLGCDPRIDRDNPFDPRSDDPRAATIEGQVLRATVDGPAPGPATVRALDADGRLADGADVDPTSGDFALTVPAGLYTLTAEAPGHAAGGLTLDVAIGERVAVEPIVLSDEQPPVAPTLSLPRGPVNTPEVVATVDHPEPGVAILIRTGGGVESTAGEGLDRALRLTDGDGDKTVIAVAVDPAGNVSPSATATIELDTTPPAEGALVLAGGARVVRSRVVDAEITGTDADRMRFEATAGPCGGCPALDCDRAFAAVDRVELDAMRGEQCVCWALCDLAGNRVTPPPVSITLGPYEPRPVPALDAVEPEIVVARVSSSADVVLRGGGIADDTVADIGAFVSLPCALDRPAGGCVDGAPERCATTCTVTLPDALRLASGRLPVRLRTPDPVVDGVGRSLEVRWLTLTAPRPLIDRVEPQGVALGPGRPTTVTVTLDAHDLTDNVEIQLAGRPPTALDFTRGSAGQPDAARIVATFDLDGLPADAERDAILAVGNPGGDRVELPFGLAPAVTPCPQGEVCRIPVRRTRPSSLPGHVTVELTPPRGVPSASLSLGGASTWTVLGPDGTALARGATTHALATLRLPGPQPAARLIADVPAHAGGLIEVAPSRGLQLEWQLSAGARSPADHGPAAAGLFADLDLDGALEGLMVHPETGRLTVDGGRAVEIGGSPSALAVGDLNGDGWPDIVVGDRAGRAITAHLGLGDTRFGPPVVLPSAALAGPVAALAITDVDGDRRPDVLAGFDGPAGGLARWIVAADGRILPPMVVADGVPVSFVAPRHTTRPGRPDIFFGGPAGIRSWSGADDAPPRPLLADGPGLGSRWVEVIGRDQAGVVRLLGSDGDGVWTLARRPGADWVLEGPRVLPGTDFRGLGVYDGTGRGRPAVLGADLGAPDGALWLVRPGAEPTPVYAPGYADPPRAPLAVHLNDPDTDLSAFALDGDGTWHAMSNLVAGVDEPPSLTLVWPTPDLPTVVGGRSAWFDVDGDGVSDLIAQGADGLATAFGPCEPRVVCAPTPGGGVGAGLDLIRAADGALTAAIGVETAVQMGPLGPDGRPGPPDIAVDLGAPVRAVQAVSIGDVRLAAAIADDRIHIVGPGHAAELVALDGRGRPTAPDRIIAADIHPEAPGEPRADEIVARTAEGLTAWAYDGGGWRALGEGIALASTLAWTLADMDGDGLLDRVELSARGGEGGDATLAVGVYRGTGGPDLFEAAPIAPPAPVAVAARAPVALATADVNVDGLPDVLVARATAGVGPADAWDVRTGVLLGRGDGALAPALDEHPCDVVAEPDGGTPPMTVAGEDLTGDGRPEIVVTLGRAVCSGALVDDAAVQNWVAELDPPPDADGGLRVPLRLPAAWYRDATLVAQVDGPSPALSGSLIGPRGDRVELPPNDAAGGAAVWTSLDGGPLAGVMGRQPGGEWLVELDPGPGGSPVTAVELLVGARWSRPSHPECWRDAHWLGACAGGRLPDRAPGPAGDCDFDGVPDIADPCPAEARWPPDPEAACGPPTHPECAP